MKFYQSIAVCLALMAGVTADECFAQSTTGQNESVAASSAPQGTAVTPAPDVSVGKTRAQVIHELEIFQKSGQADELRDLYRGS
jgi:hypothetical protein